MPSHQATNSPPPKARKAKADEAISDPRAGLDQLKDFTRKIMAVPKETVVQPKKKPK